MLTTECNSVVLRPELISSAVRFLLGANTYLSLLQIPSAGHRPGWIEADFPGIYTATIEIGNGREDSLLFNMNKQVDEFARQVAQDPKLAQGFNVIGHSQGGLIIRGYVARYNSPPVHNMISWAGPQDGVYGVPDFNSLCPDHLCPWLDELATYLSDGSWADKVVQEHFSFTNYWKPPMVCAAACSLTGSPPALSSHYQNLLPLSCH